jgi:hypothetical protein
MDNVEPEVVVDDVDTVGSQGFAAGSILRSRNTLVITSAERVAKEYGSSTMFREIRRDIKILSGEHDDWNAAQDDVAEKPVRFTTYNTLTNQ